MNFDTFLIAMLALFAVWQFLDKIGDARETEAAARQTEADARLLEAQNKATLLAQTETSDAR